MQQVLSLLVCLFLFSLPNNIVDGFSLLPFLFAVRRPSVCRLFTSTTNNDREELQMGLGLDERFDRWRFLQKLLDLETDIDDTNRVLYHALDAYASGGVSSSTNNDQTKEEARKSLLGSPERTRERLERIDAVLSQASTRANADGRGDTRLLEALVPPDFPHTPLSAELEQLLPDEFEEEDGFKGVWDSVAELHGREAVKIDQQNGAPEWIARCLVARLLLYYDFLQRGI